MLTPIRFVKKDRFRNMYWLYRCHCGNEIITRNSSVKNGNTKGCGCLKGTPKHRLHGSITYKTWDSMKRRCNNPKAHNYKNYGGRGIRIKYKSINEMVADIGLRPSRAYSIDRIDNDKHYEKGNCQWLLISENTRKARLANAI